MAGDLGTGVDGRPDGPLGRLALARGTVDRRGHHRAEPGLVERLRRDPATRVLTLTGPQVEVAGEGASTQLALRPGPDAAGGAEGADERLWFYLGRDRSGTDYLAAVTPVEPGPAGHRADPPPVPGGDGVRLAGLREIGAVLDDDSAGLVTTAVSLANWHATHVRCPRCGAATVPEQGGWTRRCTVDGSEHYPRTDPAVIVTVVDDDDRLLLGHAPAWPEGRYSTLAGFVEPGESMEDAVRREVAEESGVVVGEVRYLASQPWPFPASLMIGCTARALDPAISVDGVEITDARWFTRQQVLDDCRAGRLLVPHGISIARRLVEHWFGGPLPVEGTWR